MYIYIYTHIYIHTYVSCITYCTYIQIYLYKHSLCMYAHTHTIIVHCIYLGKFNQFTNLGMIPLIN